MDEEKGPENHPELWMRFAEGMGNSRKKVNNTTAMQEVNDLVKTFTKGSCAVLLLLVDPLDCDLASLALTF